MGWLLSYIPELPPIEMGYSRDASEAYKVILLLAGLGLVACWRMLPRWGAVSLLVVLTFTSAVNYTRLSEKLLFERMDTYDLIHYYLNTKYFDELGYFDLYPAIVRVDVDNGGPHFPGANMYRDQDETGHHEAPLSLALQKGELVRARFTPERWSAFSHDFLHLQRKMKGLDRETWAQMLADHGFNGTVAWMFVARPFTQIVPVESVKWLGYIDVVLLGTAVGFVAWAYGGSAALWTTFFLFTSYSTRWPTISWAFFRYDYVSALVVAMCLLKKGKPFWAGFLTGYATTLRMFPAMWLYGPGMKGFIGLAGKKVHRAGLVLLAGFFVGLSVLQAAGTLEFGTGNVATHFENMEDHNKSENISSRRVGLALALVYDFKLLPKIIDQPRKMVMESQRHLRYAVAAACMVLLGWGLRKRPDHEAFAFGFLPFFLLTTASYYYYVTRMPLIAMHAGGLALMVPLATGGGWKERAKQWFYGPGRHQVGLAMLVGVELFSTWAETVFPKYRWFLIGWMAWGIFAYTIVMALWYAVASRQDREPVEGVPQAVGAGGSESGGGQSGGVQPAAS